MDFGDAPIFYGTRLDDDGPRHAVNQDIRLGSQVTGETDSSGADDHLDDDGVQLNGSLVPGSTHTFDVTTSSAGTLAVWIDFNGDGNFDNSSERNAFTVSAAGVQPISVPIPASAVEGLSFARFRFSSDPDSVANPIGIAVDGEVEDYSIRIASPPKIEQVLLNGGAVQRSSLDKVRVVFDRVVDLATLTGDPFTIRNVGTGQQVTKILSVDDSSGKTIVDILFDPNGMSVMTSGGLVDGNYELIVHANGVSAAGVALDGDANGLPGGDHLLGAVDGFFRKYGDHNGNGSVDLLDFADFRRSFGKTAADPGFLSALDADGNQSIDLLDFAAFRRNFGT
jgi:hypothetical protein